MDKRSLRRLLAMGLALAACDAFPAFPGVAGRIVERSTGRPLAGVFVIAYWDYVGIRSGCSKIIVSRSDVEGRYRVSAYPFAEAPTIEFYVAGFKEEERPAYTQRARRERLERVELVPALEPPDKRIEDNWFIAYRTVTCGPRDERAQLIPLYREMLTEGLALSTTPQQRNRARGLCNQILSATLRDSWYPPNDEVARRFASIEPRCNYVRDDERLRQLSRAIQEGGVEVVARAAADGYDVNRRLADERVPIVVAAMRGDAPMVRELIKAGARVDEIQPDGYSALSAVLTTAEDRDDFAAVAGALLDAGTNPNQRVESGFPLLVIAAAVPRPKIFRLLIERGADPNLAVTCACAGDRSTSLHFLADPALVRLALECGARSDARDASGATPLMRARERDRGTPSDREVVELLERAEKRRPR